MRCCFSSTVSKRDTHFEQSFLMLKCSCEIANTLPSDIFQRVDLCVPVENSYIGSFRGSLLGVPFRFLYRIKYDNHQDPVQDP